jgi:iron complex transport system ATP-binding protein
MSAVKDLPMPSAVPALRMSGLCVGYSTRRTRKAVLENLNLSVAQGELVCLLGPNGIGKSTLIRTISKLQPSLSGTVEVGGADLRNLNPLELARRLGVVLTERVVVGALPACRVVELGRYPHLGWLGHLRERDHAVVQWAIEAVGAQHLAARDSNQLSDGERQRFMIARALAQEPLILLLDEPTAFLDVPARVELMGLLRRLTHEENLAVVATTHDLELALRMADTVWLAVPGGRFYSGAPEDIVLSGRVSEAFPSENVRFRPEERAFRFFNAARGRAIVRGDGLCATLAAAVLEREGYQVVSEPPAAITVTVSTGELRWNAVTERLRRSGETFAELARFTRTTNDVREIEQREERV